MEFEPSVPPASAVARLSTTHEAVMNWLVQNPERSLRECADTFGYTQSWLSRLIHSDIFQAKLRERQDTVFIHVAQDIPAKLRGLADVAIERVAEFVATTESPELAIDVFDKALHRLGYAPAAARTPAPAAQTNVFMVSPADLAAAREVVVGSGGTAQGADQNPTALSDQAQEPPYAHSRQGSSMGQVFPESAGRPAPVPAPGAETPGGEI